MAVAALVVDGVMAVAALVVVGVMAVAALVVDGVMVMAALVVDGVMVVAALVVAALVVDVVEVVGCRVAAADCHRMRSRQNCSRSIEGGQSHVAAFLTLSVWIKFGLAFSELIFGD